MPTLPNGLIDNETAEQMEQLYVENQYAAINNYNRANGDNEPDSRETLFSLDEMQSFIDYIKETAQAQGLSNLGIRIYQGGKEENGKIFTTVFLSPTSNGENIGGAQCMDFGCYGKPPKPKKPANPK